MNVIKKLLFTIGIILSVTNTLLGAETFAAFYENDITPPWGRIHVEKSAEVDGITYVGSNTVTAKVYANDDMCTDDEIKYYISTEPISDTSKLEDNLWMPYKAGEATEITLNDDGTGKIYAIFKDANGNTSLIYEKNAEGTQEIVFDTNGGFSEPTGIVNKRIHGMSYILPTDAPYKRGYTFLGWSTDKEANVPSYKEGDAVPPDASLGTEENVTLYAIYGTDLSEFPDLVDVVKVGDYVNYPVYYENTTGVISTITDGAFDTPTYGSKLNGWRVLSKDEEEGTVTLVSAGTPLELCRTNAATAQSIASKLSSPSGFFNTGFSSTRIDGCYTENGLKNCKSLKEAFTNKYTKIISDIPEVRAMTKDDVDYLYQYFGETSNVTEHGTLINDSKYREMIDIPSVTEGKSTYYYLATVYNSVNLWYVNGDSKWVDWRGRQGEQGIRPVVTLKSNVKAIGQNINGAWDIEIETNGKAIRIPTTISTGYTGEEQTVTLKNFDSGIMEIAGVTTATEVGTYTAIISLKDTTKYCWLDGTTEPKEINWNITDDVYATLYADGTLGFHSDETTIEGKAVLASYGNIADKSFSYVSSPVPWNSAMSSIKTVEFVSKVMPASTHAWFYGASNLTTINNISNLNTSRVTSMEYMFNGCSKLTSIDAGHFDVRNVTTFHGMFADCTSLTYLDLSNFIIDSATSIRSMFHSSSALKEVVLTSMNTSKVTDMDYMFYNCSSLKKIYVGPNWITKGTITNMFTGCGTSTLTKIQ